MIQESKNIHVDPDSTKIIENFEPKLKELGRQLDSLTQQQNNITSKLDSLKNHAAKIKKEQMQGDLLNVGLFVLFLIIIIQIFFLRKKQNTKTH